MKKGVATGILVSFHPFEILILPNNLVEDQGEREKQWIWKGHNFLSVAHPGRCLHLTCSHELSEDS